MELNTFHYSSAGDHSNVRFHEDNVCTSMLLNVTYALRGNQIEYRKQLIIKIGVERMLNGFRTKRKQRKKIQH